MSATANLAPAAAAANLIDLCRERGVALYVDGNELRYRGRRGAMTPELRQAVADHRADLVALLRPADKHELSEPFSIDHCDFFNSAPAPEAATELAQRPPAIVSVQPPTVEHPSPPKGATIFCQDAKGRPCGPETAYQWTWSGGPTWERAPTWFFVREHPIPRGHPVDGTRW